MSELSPVGQRVSYKDLNGHYQSGIVIDYRQGYYLITNDKGFEDVVTDVNIQHHAVNHVQVSYQQLSDYNDKLSEAAYIAVLKVIATTAFFLLFMYFVYIMFFKPALQS